MVSDRLGHVPALNGLRGVAILSVLLMHGYGVPGGFLGVDLFFVLSGFLITTLLLEEHVLSGRISLLRFYGRRARRLLPVAFAAIWFNVIIWVGQAILFGADTRRVLLGALFAAFYVENFAHFLHPPVVTGIGHFWSLSQEEQFYFVWPPLLIAALRRVRLSWLVAVLATLFVIVLVHRGMLAGDWRRVYFAPDTRCDGMILGCLLALVWKKGLLRASRTWLFVGPAALAVFALDVSSMHAEAQATALYGITVANVAAAAMIASVVLAPAAPLSRVLAAAPLKLLGLISYSVYIWQPTASKLGLTGTAMIVATLIVATLSYRYVEKPFRQRHAARSASSRTRPDGRVEAVEVAALATR